MFTSVFNKPSESRILTYLRESFFKKKSDSIFAKTTQLVKAGILLPLKPVQSMARHAAQVRNKLIGKNFESENSITNKFFSTTSVIKTKMFNATKISKDFAKRNQATIIKVTLAGVAISSLIALGYYATPVVREWFAMNVTEKTGPDKVLALIPKVDSTFQESALNSTSKPKLHEEIRKLLISNVTKGLGEAKSFLTMPNVNITPTDTSFLNEIPAIDKTGSSFFDRLAFLMAVFPMLGLGGLTGSGLFSKDGKKQDELGTDQVVISNDESGQPDSVNLAVHKPAVGNLPLSQRTKWSNMIGFTQCTDPRINRLLLSGIVLPADHCESRAFHFSAAATSPQPFSQRLHSAFDAEFGDDTTQSEPGQTSSLSVQEEHKVVNLTTKHTCESSPYGEHSLL